MAGELLTLLGMLLVVAAVLVLAYCVTRFLAGKALPGVGRPAGRHMRLAEQLALGREQRLAVVELGERYLLLGVSATGITLLGELTRAEWEQCQSELPGSMRPPSFQEALKQALRQKFKH